jgi:hypothetical protein
MTPKDFYELVVSPNLKDFHADPGNLRLAVNAILSLDALFGITYWALKDAGHPVPVRKNKDDTDLRDHYSDLSDDFKAFRDGAKAIKHGQLYRGETKLLVKSAKDIQSKSVVIHEVMADWPTLDATAVYISLRDGKVAGVKDVLVHSVSVAKQLLADLGTPVS